MKQRVEFVAGLTILSVVCQAACGALMETNWPQFRGAQARGVSEGFPTPSTWDTVTGDHVLWQAAIPGLGHSSPVVWSNCVFVTTAVGPGAAELKVGLYGDIEPVEEKGAQQWRLLALDKATGGILWNTLGYEGIPRVKRHPKSTHCSSTPATDGQSIVAIFGSEGLFCFDMSGKLRWRKDLGPMDSGFFAAPSAQWGFASSPVVHEGKVVVQCDVLTNSFIAAFSLADGRELWRSPRRDVPTWSTPTVLADSERQQVLVNGWHHSGGYDLGTGREVWKLDGGGDIPVPTPIVAHGMVYLTSAHGRYRPIRAVRLDAGGDITPSEIGLTNRAITWVHPRKGNYMQTPIVVGGWLFACHDTGILTCFDARTGQVQYSERLGSGGEGFTASPVASDGKLYFASEMGQVFVVSATNTFSVLGTNRMHETCMATPALSGGTLLVRTRGKLVAIGKR